VNNIDNDKLLADVLNEAAPGDFREALLGDSLRLVRKRRQLRRVSRWGGAMAVVAVASLLLLRTRVPESDQLPTSVMSYRLVLTQPLPANYLVTTKPLGDDFIVSSRATAKIVGTMHDLEIDEISDEELLALVPHPAALVRRGPHEMELLIVKPEGQTDVPVN
jgi:hypothetical protein